MRINCPSSSEFMSETTLFSDARALGFGVDFESFRLVCFSKKTFLLRSCALIIGVGSHHNISYADEWIGVAPFNCDSCTGSMKHFQARFKF